MHAAGQPLPRRLLDGIAAQAVPVASELHGLDEFTLRPQQQNQGGNKVIDLFFFLNITLLSLKKKVKNVQSNQFVHSLLQRETGESSATRSPQLHLIKPHNKLSSVSGVSAPVRQYKSYTYGSTAGGLKAGERAKLNSRCSLRLLGDKKKGKKR